MTTSTAIGGSLIAAVFCWLQEAGCFVVFEATGHDDAALRRGLDDAGVPHARVYPERAHDFAKAIGRRAKTDTADARMLAELGRRSPKAIAALVGLAPFNNDSGGRCGQRAIRGGRSRVRNALYIAAMAASRSKTPLGDFARALRERGKPPKLALIALARKILIILNAIMRNNTTYARA